VIHFIDLQSNLAEISDALYREGSIVSLFPTSQTSVRCNYSLLGKVIHMTHSIWNILPFRSELNLKNIIWKILNDDFNLAVQQVYQLRTRRLQHLFIHSSSDWQQEGYAFFLEKEGILQRGKKWVKKGEIEKYDPRAHRHTIVSFQQATEDFWHIFISDRKEHIQLRAPLMAYVSPDAFLKNNRIWQAIQKECDWVHCEGTTQKTIPVNTLYKVMKYSPLLTHEKKELQSWLDAINQAELLSVATFRHVLHDIVESSGIENMVVALQNLFCWLWQGGCLLLKREDREQMDWRDGLKKGDTITCNGLSLQIGCELGSEKEKIHDRFKIFELSDFPDYVVKIPNNRFCLFIEREKRKEKQYCGFRLVRHIKKIQKKGCTPVSGFDEGGKLVILEKLQSVFHASPWKSTDFRLCEEDEKLAKILANHLLYLQQARIAPLPLSPNYLFISKKGTITSSRILIKNPANYNKWEKFCVVSSKGNRHVLEFLIRVSKLDRHPIANYYQTAVSSVLKEGKNYLLSLSLPNGHNCPNYDQRAEKLCEAAQKIREECYSRAVSYVRKRRKGYSEGQLLTDVGKRLCEEYLRSPTPGILSTSLAEVAAKSFQQESSSKICNDSKQREKYYDNQFHAIQELEKTYREKERKKE